MQPMHTRDREILARSISQFRRSVVREFVFSVLSTFGDLHLSLPQVATLLLLDEEGELTIKQVTDILSRSVSATSRLLDQLVERGMVSRRDDVQIAVMEYYSAEEQATITRAMALLAEAGQRRRQHEHPESNPTEQ